jgi:hypothetical protein
MQPPAEEIHFPKRSAANRDGQENPAGQSDCATCDRVIQHGRLVDYDMMEKEQAIDWSTSDEPLCGLGLPRGTICEGREFGFFSRYLRNLQCPVAGQRPGSQRPSSRLPEM